MKKIFNFIYRVPLFKSRVNHFYKNPDLLVDIEFANKTDKPKRVWVEPTCIEFELDKETEYKILTNDKSFRIEFDSDNSIIFYLQYTFSCKLFKRPVSDQIRNPNEWILDLDFSDIN
jgi:hypothetical protein